MRAEESFRVVSFAYGFFSRLVCFSSHHTDPRFGGVFTCRGSVADLNELRLSLATKAFVLQVRNAWQASIRTWSSTLRQQKRLMQRNSHAQWNRSLPTRGARLRWE